MKTSEATHLVDSLSPHCCGTDHASCPKVRSAERVVIVTGNPNVGKSVIFQLLTGRYTMVSNYPGTTVMVSQGTASLGGRRVSVCDTPGINSLVAYSEEEGVARDLLLETCIPDASLFPVDSPLHSQTSLVLQVADAKNLIRALTLSLELAEAGLSMALDLNMIDEARERRISIDTETLEALLGIPVVSTIATQRWGIDRLRRSLLQARHSSVCVPYPAVIERALTRMESLLPVPLPSRRAVALLWLSGDHSFIRGLKEKLSPAMGEALSRLTLEAQEQSAVSLGLLIAQARLREARRIAKQVVTTEVQASPPVWQHVGALAMHPVWGLGILLGVLALMYFLVGYLAAQRSVEWLEEIAFGKYVTPALTLLTQVLIPWKGLQSFFIGDYGLLTMALPYAFAIILPIVGMFFLCFGFIEDVGYLPRLAVMANRFCRLLGLNGKAVLPLVLGLGCDTMATMTTRILEAKRDRILVTLLLALGIPCSAQLGVIFAMLAGSPALALGIWCGVIMGVLVIVGQVASRLLPGEESLFLYEIPPLRRPKLSNVLIKTLGRLEWYVKEAVPLFFLGTVVLFLLDVSGALTVLEKEMAPLVVGWLGLPAKATGAFIVGFLRRDFGAAGLFSLQRAGGLDGVQTLVSLVTITLFVPCIAQYFMMVKERGWKMATGVTLVVFGIALLVGGLLFRALILLRIPL